MAANFTRGSQRLFVMLSVIWVLGVATALFLNRAEELPSSTDQFGGLRVISSQPLDAATKFVDVPGVGSVAFPIDAKEEAVEAKIKHLLADRRSQVLRCIAKWGAIAVFPPVGLYTLGVALVWVGRGFRTSGS